MQVGGAGRRCAPRVDDTEPAAGRSLLLEPLRDWRERLERVRADQEQCSRQRDVTDRERQTAVDAEVRLYDHLFAKPDPDEAREGQTFLANLNPKSLEALTGCKLEPSVAGSAVGKTFQFERLGYFCVDRDSTPGKLVFNRAVTLRDTWAKIEKKTK